MVLTDILRTVLTLDPSQWNAGLAAASGNLNRFTTDVDAANARSKSLSSGIAAATGATLAMGAGLTYAVQQAASLEQIEIGFKGVLGSAAAAQAKIAELREFSRVSPFNFQQSARAAQSLMAMGLAAEQTIPVMTALGNAIALAGRGQDEFNRAMFALGQIQSKNKVFAEELRQLQEAGVDTSAVLKELGVTLEDVGTSGVDAARFFAAFTKTMTEGRFAGAMEAQSKTLIGSLSSLQDAAEELAASLGGPTAAAIGFVARGLTTLTNAVNKADPIVKAFAGTLFGLGTLAAAGTVVWLKALEIQNMKLLNSHLKAAGGAATHAAQLRLLGTTAATSNARISTLSAQTVAGGPMPGAIGAAGAGRLAQMRAALNRPGVGLGAAAVLAGLGTSMIPTQPGTTGEGLKNILGDAVTGALTGAAIGSFFPGLGTAIGAAIGGVGGAAFGAFQSMPGKEAEKTGPTDPILEELKKQNETLRLQLAELQGLRRPGRATDDPDLPDAYARRAAAAKA